MVMVKELYTQIQEDYPDYAELSTILDIAAVTWPRFGISAGELAEMDDLTLDMVILRLGC